MINTYYFAHPLIENSKKYLVAYGAGYSFKFDENLKFITQYPVAFHYTSSMAAAFPAVKVFKKYFGIPLNCRKLFSMNEYSIEEVCDAPSVYAFGYCKFRRGLLAFDYFKLQFYYFENTKFEKFQINEFKQTDAQLFNCDDRVLVFSKNSDSVMIIDNCQNTVFQQVGYVGQVVFSVGQFVYTTNCKLLDLQSLAIYNTVQFIPALRYACYFSGQTVNESYSAKFDAVFQKQILEAEFNHYLVAKNAVLSEELNCEVVQTIHSIGKVDLVEQAQEEFAEIGGYGEKDQQELECVRRAGKQKQVEIVMKLKSNRCWINKQTQFIRNS